MSEPLIKEYDGVDYKAVPEPVAFSCEGCVWAETRSKDSCVNLECGDSPETTGVIWVPETNVQQQTPVEVIMSDSSIKEYEGTLFQTFPEIWVSSCEGCAFYGFVKLVDDDEGEDNSPCAKVGCGDFPETSGVIWVPYKKLARVIELEKALKAILEYFESGNCIPVQKAAIKADSPEILEARRLLTSSTKENSGE